MIRLALLLALAGTGAEAQCRITVNRCVTIPEAQRHVPPYDVGDILPRGSFNVLFNATYCGLPPAEDGGSYVRVARDVFKVDMATLEVLAIVTDDLAGNCR